MLGLSILFLVTAALYAAVGFGGGSTYTALLAASETDYRLVPAVSLVCNILVVAGGIFHATRQGALDLKASVPWFVASVPLAFVGGRLPLSEKAFLILLCGALLIAGGYLLRGKAKAGEGESSKLGEGAAATSFWLPTVIGAGLGFLSGLVGIGGGVFLAPVLYVIRWGSARKIAATCSLFILVNSLSGLAGQLWKLDGSGLLPDLPGFWPLALAVVVGGQLGSFFSMNRLSGRLIQRLTGLLILIVVARLGFRLVGTP